MSDYRWIELTGYGPLDGQRIAVPSLPPDYIVPILRPMRVWLNAARDDQADIPIDEARFVWANRLTKDGAHVYEFQP